MDLTQIVFSKDQNDYLFMKKLLGILVIGLLFCSIGYAKTKITEVKKSIKEDGDGILKLDGIS